jgi:hypothetical protein
MGQNKTRQRAKQDKNAITYCHYEGYGINIPNNQKSAKK